MRAVDIDWSLYVILDRDLLTDGDMAGVAEALLAGGATVLQLRDKSGDTRTIYEEAWALQSFLHARKVPLIINDRLDIALAAGADGVHLGQEDLHPAIARKVAPGLIIGASVHNLTEYESLRAAADYYGVGTMFKSPTKPELVVTGPQAIADLRCVTSAPLVGIGGVNEDNCEQVMAAGADGVVVASALFRSRDIVAATRRLSAKVKASKHTLEESSGLDYGAPKK